MARCCQQLPTSTQAATDADSSECRVKIQLLAATGTEVSAGGSKCCSTGMGQDEARRKQTRQPVNSCPGLYIQHWFP